MDRADTIRYQSDLGNSISFMVHGVQGTAAYNCEKCAETDCSCRQAGGYRFASLDRAWAMDVIRISQFPDNEKVMYRFAVFNIKDDAYQRTFYYHEVPTNTSALHQTDVLLASFDDQQYTDVIHSRISIMDRPDDVSMQISDMWISFEHGLLQWYDSMQDETWTLRQ